MVVNKLKKVVYIILCFIVPAAAAFLISSFPSFRLQFLSEGHDLFFHIQAIKGQSYTLQHRMFPIYLNPQANGGAGDCRYIVYPYLFTYIPAIIYNITANIQVSINIFIILVNIATFFSTYKASMVIFKDKVQAVFASAFFLLCFYRVFNIYQRQAMGEYIALAFTPLVIGGFYNIFFGDKKKWYYLVIGLICLIQSHVITAFYYILFVIVASIICIPFIIKDKKILKYYILSGALIILLNLWYLVPFLQYYFEAEVDIASFGQYVKAFNTFNNNFIIDYRKTSRLFNCLGFESIMAMIVIPILFNLIYVAYKNKDKDYKIDKKFITAIVFLLIFYYFFIVSMWAPNIGIFEYIYTKQQFLYRELGRGLPFLAMAFGYAVSHICDNKILKILLVYVFLIVSAFTTVTYISTKLTTNKFDAKIGAAIPDYLFYSGSDGDNGKRAKNQNKAEKYIDYEYIEDNTYERTDEYDEYMDEYIKEEHSNTISNQLFRKESSGFSLNVSNDAIDLDSISKGILYYAFSYTYDGANYADQYVEIPLVAFTGYKGVDESGNDIIYLC